MDVIQRVFLDHPRRVNESYLEHAAVAMRFGLAMIGGGLACLVHGLVPALFTRTGSDTVRRLHARMTSRLPAPSRRENDAGFPAMFIYEI